MLCNYLRIIFKEYIFCTLKPLNMCFQYIQLLGVIHGEICIHMILAMLDYVQNMCQLLYIIYMLVISFSIPRIHDLCVYRYLITEKIHVHQCQLPLTIQDIVLYHPFPEHWELLAHDSLTWESKSDQIKPSKNHTIHIWPITPFRWNNHIQ